MKIDWFVESARSVSGDSRTIPAKPGVVGTRAPAVTLESAELPKPASQTGRPHGKRPGDRFARRQGAAPRRAVQVFAEGDLQGRSSGAFYSDRAATAIEIVKLRSDIS